MDAKVKRVKIREYGAQQLEALGFAPKMEFELEDGSILALVHPWLWDDQTQAAYDAARTDEDSKEPYNVRVAKAIIGEDDHKKFIAGGGSSNQIALALELMKRPTPVTNGEDDADPKD